MDKQKLIRMAMVIPLLDSAIPACSPFHVTLTYPPPPKEILFAGKSAINEVSNRVSEIPIALVPLPDTWSSQQKIGDVRNSYGMSLQDVVADNSVANWVTQALKMEMEKLGYQVTLANPDNPPSSGLVISGEVLTVYCSSMYAYDADVAFRIKMMKDGQNISSQRYSGKGGGAFLLATPGGYAHALARALNKAIQEFLRDLDYVTNSI